MPNKSVRRIDFPNLLSWLGEGAGGVQVGLEKIGKLQSCRLLCAYIIYGCSLLEYSHMTSDVFLGIFDLPTYPNQILYYIILFSKIR